MRSRTLPFRPMRTASGLPAGAAQRLLVIGPHHDLAFLDHVAVPWQDDEAGILERDEVGLVAAGADRDGGLHGLGAFLAQRREREADRVAALARAVHEQDLAPLGTQRRAGDERG